MDDLIVLLEEIANGLISVDEAREEDNGEAVEAAIAEKRRLELDWPKVTDCDRLDAAFDRIQQADLIAIQHAGFTLSDGLDDVEDEQKYRTHQGRPARGYCFFHGQDILTAVEEGQLPVAFGSFDDFEQLSARIGHEVVKWLRAVGLSVTWSGRTEERIFVKVTWQRRLDQPLPPWEPKDRPYPFETDEDRRRGDEGELRTAALLDDVERLERLIRQGVDFRAADWTGATALHKAAFGGCLKAVEFLVAAGANPTAVNDSGETPAHVAIRRGHHSLAKVLSKLVNPS